MLKINVVSVGRGTVPTLLELLSANNVSLLIDVRENPISRKRGFSKVHLEKSVPGVGIEYLHFADLGTPPPIRKVFAETGDIQKALKQYEKHLRSRTQHLRSLLKRVSHARFCLLCLESDHTCCHRSIISMMLTEMTGCQSIHLT